VTYNITNQFRTSTLREPVIYREIGVFHPNNDTCGSKVQYIPANNMGRSVTTMGIPSFDIWQGQTEDY
jgi:hypothetical protein